MPRDEIDAKDHKGDGNNEGPSRKPPRKLDEETRASIRDSRSLFKPKLSPQDEELKRRLKWLNHAKNKVTFGFNHLDSAYLPQMSEDRHGYAIYFDKITGWNVPGIVGKALESRVNKTATNVELQVRLSMSMYHLATCSFFGSTWMGPPMSLDENVLQNLNKVIDFQYQDIVYMITRIIDPSCVAIVEIVLCQYDKERQTMVSQFG